MPLLPFPVTPLSFQSCPLPFFNSRHQTLQFGENFIKIGQQLKKTSMFNITKTYIYNFAPLKPHFYTVKLGFTGVYIIFLILLKNTDCGYSLELPRRGGSNKYPQSMFLSRNVKKIRIFIWKFSVFDGKIFSIYLNRLWTLPLSRVILIQQETLDDIYIFPRKQDLTFHANCLQ